MTKRIIALLLCALMLVPCLAACAKKDEDEDRGAYIVMYLSDEIYDLDPANAYYNTEVANIMGMLFDTLFKLDENGKVKKSLVSKYTITEDDVNNEYYMLLTLREAFWSNGTALSSEDVVYTFKRLLNSNNSFAAASLLYDIKNARAVKEGDISIDDLGVEAVEANVVKISFEGPIDYDQFMLNLTNVATAPLLENYVVKDPDWAKKSSTMVTSGPFKLGKINYREVAIDTETLVKDMLNADWADKVAAFGEEINNRTDLSFDLGMTADEINSFIDKCEQYIVEQGIYIATDDDSNGLTEVRDITGFLNRKMTVTDLNGTDEFGTPYKNAQVATVKVVNYFYLERNNYFMRDPERDAIDEGVKPYRLLVDCSKTDAELLQDYKDGKIFYMNNIPLSLRGDATIQAKANITNALSTFVCYLNENAVIADGGEGTKLFADKTVRQALSLAIDRQAIANAIVYADAATALVPYGVFEGASVSKKTDFRTTGGDILAKSANLDSAKQLLATAEIDATKYSFSIKVSAADEVHVKIAQMVCAAWNELGFNVTVDYEYTIQNNDYFKGVGGITSDICDDQLLESLKQNNYEVLAFDYNAFSADAYSMLSNFALQFSGMALNIDLENNEYNLVGNSTGYNSKAYNDLMEAIYFIPYFARLTAALENPETKDDFSFLGLYESMEELMEVYNAVKSVYAEYGITPSTKSSDWTAQKALLLHKAEELLMEEMPVIPVIFNKNATISTSDVSKVTSNPYTPCDFRNAKFKNYESYVYYDEKGSKYSIFEEFPFIVWDAKGEVVTEAPTEAPTEEPVPETPAE